MRLSFIIAAGAALALSGCVAAIPPIVSTPGPVIVTPPPAPGVGVATRTAATQVVNMEMARRLPGRNVSPYTSCVLENATMAEVADLATLSGQAGAADAVASIVKRPATTQCIARVAVA